MITRRHFGNMPDGQAVDEYTLTNVSGLSVSIIPYGAIVTRLLVPDRRGKFDDIVCGFDNLDQYLAGHPYFGCIAGRVAGRITRGRFTLDGKAYQLARNDPPNHLHGGNVGFDKRLWTVASIEPCFEPGGDQLGLTLRSVDGDEGYPGNLDVTVTYLLSDDDYFIVDYMARSDRPTPLNLTHHGYFNLQGEGRGTIHDHLLKMDADFYAPTDRSMTLLGRCEPVEGLANDFSKLQRVGNVIEDLWQRHGDLYFIRDANVDNYCQIGHLYDPRSGRVMEFGSNEPCLQLYTGVSLDGSLVGKSGRPYQQFGALCLECQRYPDAVNTTEFGDIILRPEDDPYSQTTIYSFLTD